MVTRVWSDPGTRVHDDIPDVMAWLNHEVGDRGRGYMYWEIREENVDADEKVEAQ